ncbi:MAG TPA: hypothetical protein VEJ87_16800, partial [Acidimicrobiales bacterium]|nr:hypothetical protein [Acidimicrobiales bacterium]
MSGRVYEWTSGRLDEWTITAPDVLRDVEARLRKAGCIAAEEEAAELAQVANGDLALLSVLVERRCEGEPLAWLTGSVRFCGEKVLVNRGV